MCVGASKSLAAATTVSRLRVIARDAESGSERRRRRERTHRIASLRSPQSAQPDHSRTARQCRTSDAKLYVRGQICKRVVAFGGPATPSRSWAVRARRPTSDCAPMPGRLRRADDAAKRCAERCVRLDGRGNASGSLRPRDLRAGCDALRCLCAGSGPDPVPCAGGKSRALVQRANASGSLAHVLLFCQPRLRSRPAATNFDRAGLDARVGAPCLALPAAAWRTRRRMRICCCRKR